MFLNKTKFKKWIKDAYNRGGLTVGRIHDGLVICGPICMHHMDRRWVYPKLGKGSRHGIYR